MIFGELVTLLEFWYFQYISGEKLTKINFVLNT